MNLLLEKELGICLRVRKIKDKAIKKRGKRYATEILSLALEKSKELNLDKVLLVCNSTNVASSKVILNNGGISDEDFIDEQNNILKRYWIRLT